LKLKLECKLFLLIVLSTVGKRYGTTIESSETSGFEPFERDSECWFGWFIAE
jgi:hypothetical protein